MERKNVYFGTDSTAQIIVSSGSPEKVDTSKDLMIVTYALAYDLKDKLILTRIPGKLEPNSIRKINGRFFVLYQLADRINPNLKSEIQKFHDLAIKRYNGEIDEKRYLNEIRRLAGKYLNYSEIRMIEERIDRAGKKRLTNFSLS